MYDATTHVDARLETLAKQLDSCEESLKAARKLVILASEEAEQALIREERRLPIGH